MAGDVWFTSDTHLGHAAIMRHQNRQFADTDAMDAALIDTLNKYVKYRDTLYHLGDFCWRASRMGHYRQRIRVRQIHVAQGNHDASSLRRHVSSMELMYFKKFGERKFHLMHYPALSWNVRVHGGCHLYGHCHGMGEEAWDKMWPDRRAMDVGVDNAWRMFKEYRPYNLDEIIQLIGNRMPPAEQFVKRFEVPAH